LRSISGLDAEERAAIAAQARIRTFEAGETVFNLGSPGDHMMAVLSGTIRISVPSADGKELVLTIIQPGEVFGELAVLDGKERSADAIAENACTLAMLYRSDVSVVLPTKPIGLAQARRSLVSAITTYRPGFCRSRVVAVSN
jgi:CRP/FNR family transcriptional regulator, cyclic AMP receptor protein